MPKFYLFTSFVITESKKPVFGGFLEAVSCQNPRFLCTRGKGSYKTWIGI